MNVKNAFGWFFFFVFLAIFGVFGQSCKSETVGNIKSLKNTVISLVK